MVEDEAHEIDHLRMTKWKAPNVFRPHPPRFETVLVGMGLRLERARGARPNDEPPPAGEPALARMPVLIDAYDPGRLDEDPGLLHGLADGGLGDRLSGLEPARGGVPELAVFPLAHEQHVPIVLDDDEDEERGRDATTTHSPIVARALRALQASFANIRCNTCIMAYAGDLLEHLRSFAVLAAHVDRRASGAFARAASELAVDVSVLRRRMQALTEHVGSPLVDGRGASMRITKAGEITRDLAGRALDAVDQLAGYRGARNLGPLRIACTGTFLAEVLPPVLATVRDQHPGLRFRVRREGATASRDLLARGDVDFAVVRSTATPEGVASKRLGRDRLWLAMRKDCALARASRLTAEAMAREPLVGYSSTSSTMRRVMDVLRPHGGAPWVEVDGKTAALRYVAAGLGIAFISLLEGQEPSQPRVVVRDVTSHFPPVSFHLVWPRGRELDGYRRTFAETLHGAC